MLKKIGFFILFVLYKIIVQEPLHAQSHDSLYYEKYNRQLTSRLYMSRKFTEIKINNSSTDTKFTYSPSSTHNLGVGATYRFLTLNLAYGFNFLNPDKGQEETKYLDLQLHAYPQKFAIDGFGQFYNGYYIRQDDFLPNYQPAYYNRGDISTLKIGASVQYVFNHKKFSYRAAYLQNEWQKKSAGTLLLGFEAYGGNISGDNMLIPKEYNIDPAQNYNQINFIEFGPNIGYAYSLVLFQHFFITASASTNMGIGYNKLHSPTHESSTWGINPNLFLKGFIGYNSKTWSINTNYVYNQVRLPDNSNWHNTVATGNYRINFIYRFQPGPKTKKILKYIDFVADK